MHRKAATVSAKASLAYVEEYLAEDEPLMAARASASEVGGAQPIGPAGGAALRFIAAAINARTVVEIGTGCGTSGIWLLRGKALEVLPRLTDGAYDMVFCDGDKQEYPDYLAAALRLLRPGGVVAFDNALWGGRVADSARSDPDTVAIRNLCEQFRDDDRLVPALLPVGDGLLAAVKRAG